MEHLDDNAASEFVSGALPPHAVTKVEGHLAMCRDCRALVATLAADAGDDSNVATQPHEKMSPSQVAALPKRTLTVGDRVGRYLVLSSLGAGGMGVVFSAYDPQLDRKIALKLLRAGVAISSKDARTRLKREAQAIAQLSHPNVVAVYDVGTTDDNDLYIAMEFVEGDTLTTWIKKYPRTWREVIEIYLQAARGLVAAHGVGLLHRDFKPDNVLVGGDGRVRVTDFGLARSLLGPDEAARVRPEMSALDIALTATGTVLGTPRYMPPEQLTGPDIDARSDQFSFCVALYESLYGVHPLRDGTSVSMLEHGDKASPPPEGTKIPAVIGRAVLRGIASSRARGVPPVAELMRELAPAPVRSPVRFAAFALVILMLLGGATAAVFVHGDARPPLISEGQSGAEWYVKELNKLKAQIKVLDTERHTLIDQLSRHATDEKTIIELQTRLVEKDKQIADLVTRVTQLQPQGKPTKVPPSQSALVTVAVALAQNNIDGCLDEWVERVDRIPGKDGSLQTPDVDLLVRLSVSPDGLGYSPVTTMRTSDTRSCSKEGPDPNPRSRATVTARGEADCHDSLSLRLCVEGAITGVKFPLGTDRLDLEVGVGWSQGLLNLSPRVVGHHQGLRSILDLD